VTGDVVAVDLGQDAPGLEASVSCLVREQTRDCFPLLAPRRVDNFSWKWTLTSVNEVACSPGQEVKIMSLF
jgi:hypothetical protein